MISLEKLRILTSLQKLPKNVGDLGKLIVAKGFEKLPNLVTLSTTLLALAVILLWHTMDGCIDKISYLLKGPLCFYSRLCLPSLREP